MFVGSLATSMLVFRQIETPLNERINSGVPMLRLTGLGRHQSDAVLYAQQCQPRLAHRTLMCVGNIARAADGCQEPKATVTVVGLDYKLRAKLAHCLKLAQGPRNNRRIRYLANIMGATRSLPDQKQSLSLFVALWNRRFSVNVGMIGVSHV